MPVRGRERRPLPLGESVPNDRVGSLPEDRPAVHHVIGYLREGVVVAREQGRNVLFADAIVSRLFAGRAVIWRMIRLLSNWPPNWRIAFVRSSPGKGC